jgi:hypothetical protein
VVARQLQPDALQKPLVLAHCFRHWPRLSMLEVSGIGPANAF